MNDNKKTIFCAISLPYHIKDSYPTAFNINVTTYFTDPSIEYDYMNLTNNLEYLGVNNLIIITITKNSNITLEKIYESDNSYTKNYIVPSKEFFSRNGIEKYLIEQDLEIRIQTETSLPFDHDT
jgi:hypothetical protein